VLSGHQQTDAATLHTLLMHSTSTLVVQLESKHHSVALRYDTSGSRWLVLDSELPAPALLSTYPVQGALYCIADASTAPGEVVPAAFHTSASHTTPPRAARLAPATTAPAPGRTTAPQRRVPLTSTS
jgi:hypothetical protein